MKRIFAILLAFLLLAAPAALAEAAEQPDPAAGDWYASAEGVPVTLSLAPDGGYTLALPAALGAPKAGTWALDDGFVRLDDGSVLNLVNEELLIWTDNRLFFTREAPALYVPADLLDEAILELFAGYWKCAFVDADGQALPAAALDEATDLYIDGAAVALGGPRFGDIFWQFDFTDGVMYADVNGRRVTLTLQQDGLLRLTLAGEDPATLYLAPVPEGEANALDAILANGVLRVGTTGDYQPMSYLDPSSGAYMGFDADLAEDLAAALGVKLEYVETSCC